MPAGTRPERGGRWITVASGLIAAIAVAGVVVALTSGGSPRPAAPPRPAGDGGPANARYVAATRCDDHRTAEETSDPATPWCTLGAAARNAPPGSQILVAPGRYPELRVTDPRPAVRDLVFRPADPKVRPALAGAELAGVRDVTLTGFRFTAPAKLMSTVGVTLRDNDFDGTYVYLRTTRRTSILDNRIHRVHGGDRALLAQGSFTGDGPTTEDLVVRGNRFEDIQHDAIAVYNGYRRVLVEGNEISGVSRPAGFPLHSDAMQFMGGDHLTVRDNIVFDCNQGILVKDGSASTGLEVTGNLITRVTGAGLQLFNAPGAHVARNTVWDTRFGTIFRNDGNVEGSTSVRLDGNVLDQLIVDGTVGATVSEGVGNVFGRGRAYGTHSYRGTPNFVDVAGGDLRILPAEPGAGMPPGQELPGSRLRIR